MDVKSILFIMSMEWMNRMDFQGDVGYSSGIPEAKIVKCGAKETIGNDNCYYCERDLEDIGLLK